MNWDDIAVFLALAESGTARAAAQRLRLSQPTVGRRIERLESELRLRLFDRSRTGYVLTRQGTELLATAEAMGAAARDLTQRAVPADGEAAADIRLSSSDWPAMLLAGHAARLPGLEIDLSDETAALSMRQADMAIRHDIPASGDFVARRLGEIVCAVYAGAGYLERHPEAATEARFAACDWIAFTREQAHYGVMLWLEERLAGREPQFRASTTPAIHEAVAAGSGLAVLPRFLADRDPRCVRVSEVLTALPSEYWLVVHRPLLRRPAVRRTVDAIAAIFAELESWNGRAE